MRARTAELQRSIAVTEGLAACGLNWAAAGNGRARNDLLSSPDLARHRLIIGALAVCVASRRSGIGTALMMAVEEAGRARGAAVAVLDTNLLSDLSVPFYEDRMGYRRRAVIFRKALGRADPNS
jgi:ribosomal protein S18 acetylase RimI-like enzyme